MDKPAIRLLVQEKISHMSADHKQQESKNVCTQLTEILSKKEFNTVITYQAFPDEVDISEIGDWYYRN
jgi:5-formyltetrahydrofolate cyclo-ligase